MLSQTDDVIQFYLIGHYATDTDPTKTSEIKKFLIELKTFDQGWRFTTFALA